MKLKTKFEDEDFKLGEVVDANIATKVDGKMIVQISASRGGLITHYYSTLKKFMEDWGDADGWKVGLVKSKLAKIEVSLQDYCEDGKAGFTWYEAMEIEKKLPDGWRLPTRSEWCLLCEEFGQNENGELDPKELMKNLNMDPSSSFGRWWSSTVYSDAYAYYLGVNTSAIYPQHDNIKSYSFALRFVRDLGGKE